MFLFISKHLIKILGISMRNICFLHTKLDSMADENTISVFGQAILSTLRINKACLMKYQFAIVYIFFFIYPIDSLRINRYQIILHIFRFMDLTSILSDRTGIYTFFEKRPYVSFTMQVLLFFLVIYISIFISLIHYLCLIILFKLYSQRVNTWLHHYNYALSEKLNKQNGFD